MLGHHILAPNFNHNISVEIADKCLKLVHIYVCDNCVVLSKMRSKISTGVWYATSKYLILSVIQNPAVWMFWHWWWPTANERAWYRVMESSEGGVIDMQQNISTHALFKQSYLLHIILFFFFFLFAANQHTDHLYCQFLAGYNFLQGKSSLVQDPCLTHDLTLFPASFLTCVWLWNQMTVDQTEL